MTARGFQGPAEHEMRAALPPAPAAARARRWAADAALLLVLAALGYASYAVL